MIRKTLLRSAAAAALLAASASASHAQPAGAPPAGDPPPSPFEAPPVSPFDQRIAELNGMLSVLPHVSVEHRGGRLAAVGWTRDAREAAVLARILEGSDIIDLTTDRLTTSDRMVEIDVVIVTVNETMTESIGFNFLQLVNLQWRYVQGTSNRPGQVFGPQGQFGTFASDASRWASLFQASVNYNVNLANAFDESVRVLARPHLTTLNGRSAEFQSGGEIVFRVSGIDSGDIRPYPFGIRLDVTPTVLPGLDGGADRVLLEVEAERTSVLGRLLATATNDDINFDKTRVLSEALLEFDETLVLSGLYQREHRDRDEGVPFLRRIPVVRLFFSNRLEVDEVQSTVIFLTPRDPARINMDRQQRLRAFVDRRFEYVEATLSDDPAVIDAFQERHPDWFKIQPNNIMTELYLVRYSDTFRALRGYDLEESRIVTELPTTAVQGIQSAREARRARR